MPRVAKAPKVSERVVKDRIKRVLDKFGAHWFMPAQGQFARKGVADFIVCLQGGRYMAIEAKASTGRPTALQARFLERVDTLGGIALVVGPDDIPALAAQLTAALPAAQSGYGQGRTDWVDRGGAP